MPILISQLGVKVPPRMTNQLPSNPMNNGARVEEGQNYLNYEEPKYLGPKGGKGSGRGMTQALNREINLQNADGSACCFLG